MMKLRDKLIADKYSASSIRNYFTILTSLYKKASNTWLYPVENIASNLDLPKPNNAIQRYWASNEKDRLMASLSKRSPWLIPIVELSLELSFRRGELVQAPVRPRKAKSIDVDARSLEPEKETSPALTEDGGKKPKIMQGGLRWECIDWEKNSLTLEKEKNDRTKKVTEFKGRTVPLTKRMQEILRPLYDASPTKTGLVFSGTINSVSNSFHQACLTADPPIQGLTFHSLRKIATKDLAKKVGNPMMLGKLSGHKNIEVLYKRYYEVTLDELWRC
ncbi:MAG: tyrosine-type recombinase/integrase [Betaproteobacteria bacterium]|nr:tyrosine-type recombinase/integrase [Betaproteobacteria bacterium]